MKFLKPKSKNKGFTLIETLVSLALFTIVLVIAAGTVVSVIDINKRNQAISSVVNNLNYSIDSMVRDIKTGYLYKCNYEGSNGNKTISDMKADTTTNTCKGNKIVDLISTISGEHVIVEYKFIPADSDSGANGYIEKTTYGENGLESGKYSITDKTNVNIEAVSFDVTNPDSLDCESDCNYGQPSVSVIIKGKAGSQTLEVSKFYVQTFISQRLINITDFKH